MALAKFPYGAHRQSLLLAHGTRVCLGRKVPLHGSMALVTSVLVARKSSITQAMLMLPMSMVPVVAPPNDSGKLEDEALD